MAPLTVQPSARGTLPPQATNLLQSLELQVHNVQSPQYYLLTLHKLQMKMLKMQKHTSVRFFPSVPCAPLNVTFSASLAKVGWNESLLATNYTVYGVTSSGRTKLCMTSMLLCSVTNFSSGQIVVTASNTAGESGDSVPVSGK